MKKKYTAAASALMGALLCFGAYLWAHQAPKLIQTERHVLYLGKTPEWVQTAPDLALLSVEAARDKNPGQRHLIDDQQWDYRDAQPKRYRRVAVLITGKDALDAFDKVNVLYSSVFQKATLHHLQVWRDGKRMDRLNKSEVELTPAWQDKEGRALPGFVNATLPVKDLRLGDVLDYAYTIEGDNPLLGSHIDAAFDLQKEAFTDYLRVRLLTDSSRNIQVRLENGAEQGQIKKTERTQEYLHEFKQLPGQVVAQDAPRWASPLPSVQYSEFKSWREVAQWGAALFPQGEKTSEKVLELVQPWMQASDDPTERVALALRFVQEEITYFSAAIGTNADLPSSPEVVLGRRYGDSKDKANVLVALLRAMGYAQSYPVLVSSWREHTVKQALPSARVFDHAIVQVVLADKAHWLDPTLRHQPLSITDGTATAYGHGLVVGAQAEGLTPIQTASHLSNWIKSTFTYEVVAWKEPVQLTALIQSRGRFQEKLLDASQSGQLDQVLKPWMNALTQTYPGLSLAQKTELEFDTSTGIATLRFQASLPQPFIEHPSERKPVLPLSSLLLSDMLLLKVEAHRKTPLALGAPVMITHKDVIHWPEAMSPVNSEAGEVEDGVMSFSRVLKYGEKETSAAQVFALKRAYLKPQELDRHLQVRKQALDKWMLSHVLAHSMSMADKEQKAERQFQTRYSHVKQSLFAAFLQARYLKDVQLLQNKLDQMAYNKASQSLIGQDISVLLSLAGKPQEALQAIDHVLVLDALDQKAMSHKGQVQVQLGDFSGAIQTLEQAQKLGASDSETWGYLGLAHLFLGQNKQALDAFESRLNASEQIEGQWLALIWMRIAADRARIDFGYYENRYEKQWQSMREWPASVYEYLAGKIDDRALQRAAQSKDALTAWRNQCEVDFYRAMQMQSQGKTQEARELFKKTAHNGVVDYAETWLARLHLAPKP